jgi:hypothetical protein
MKCENLGGKALEKILPISHPFENPSPRAPPAAPGRSAEISAPGLRAVVDGGIDTHS